MSSHQSSGLMLTRSPAPAPLVRLRQLVMVGLAVLVAAALALMLTLFLLERTHPLHATKVWMASWFILFIGSALWQLAFALKLLRLPKAERRAPLASAIALLAGVAAGTMLVDLAVYLSDDFNHLYTLDQTFRSICYALIPAILFAVFQTQRAILDSAVSDHSVWQTWCRQARQISPAIAILATGVIGLLAASAYVTVIGDDYARYWTIADALSSGAGYPASTVGSQYQAGGMSAYLVDLPGLPLAMMLSFALLGHNVLAAMMPTLVAGTLFTVVSYLAYRELMGGIAISMVGSVGLTMFPFLTFYVLRSSEPDGMFVTLTMLMALLAIKSDGHRRSSFNWIGLGATAAAVALTRPEGIAYAGVTFLTLFLAHRRNRGFWLAAAVCGLLLAVFSATMLLTYGVPWPMSFVGAAQLSHMAQNLDGFVTWGLPRYSEALGMPQPVVVLIGTCVVVLFLIGTLMLAKGRPQLLFLALIPILSILLFLMASPALTRPYLPYDFFRRAAYGLPLLALVATYPVAGALRHRSQGLKQLGIALLLLMTIVVVPYEAKLEAKPEAVYQGGTQILTSGLYLMGTDLIANPYPLPRMSFEWDGHAVVVSKAFDYLGFRTNVTNFFSPMDLHGFERATGYPVTSLTIFLLAAGYIVIAREHRTNPS